MAEKKAPDGPLKSGIKSFLAGGAGGMSLVFVGQPFDTTKVKLQTAAPGQFSGMVDCIRKTIAADGVKGLYRGMSAPLAGITPIFAVYFWGFDQGKQIAVRAGGPLTNSDGSISTSGIMFAGGVSALPGTALMVPGERIKVMCQATGSTVKGPGEAIRVIMRESGLMGFYKGSALTLMRDVPGSIAYYGGYEIVKDALAPSDGSKPGVASVLTAGGLAGMANWVVAVPPDVLKSRLQAATPERYPGGGRQVFQELMAKEGLAGLYKGIGPALVRAVPSNAACFLAYESSATNDSQYLHT